MNLRLTFTGLDNKRVTVFLNHIIAITDLNNQTGLTTSTGFIIVNTPYDDVMKMLPN